MPTKAPLDEIAVQPDNPPTLRAPRRAPTGQVDLAVVAMLPPPIAGNTVYTEHLLKSLAARQPVAVFNMSPANPTTQGVRGKLSKAWRALLAVCWLLARAARRHKVLYTSADHGLGLFYNMLVVGAARLVGYRAVVNHHSFSYVDQYDWRMNLLHRLMGSRGTHVFLCDCMQKQFLARYGDRSRALILPVYFRAFAAAEVVRAIPRGRPLVVGHLSNLCLEKGTDLVIDTFRALVASGVDVRLVIGGPCNDRPIEAAVEAAKAEFGERFDYRGLLVGDAKRDFYQEIDLFLFPTRYRVEAQPIVLTEALSAGCPVITFDRGCIRDLVGSEGGIVVGRDQDFVAAAVPIIRGWHDDRDAFAEAQSRATERGNEIRREGSAELAAFEIAVNEIWN